MGASQMQRSQLSFAISGSSCITIRSALIHSSMAKTQFNLKQTFSGSKSTLKSSKSYRSESQKLNFFYKTNYSIWTT